MNIPTISRSVAILLAASAALSLPQVFAASPALPETMGTVSIPAQEWPVKPGPREIAVTIRYPRAGSKIQGVLPTTGLMLSLHNWGGTGSGGSADPGVLAEKYNVVAISVDYLQSGKKASIDDPELTVLCVHTDGDGNSWNDAQGSQWWYLTEKMNWTSADLSCAELAKRTRAPWRLPSIEELADSIKNGIQSDKNKAFGRDYLTFTWSSEVVPRVDSDEAFAVDLRDGKQHMTDVDETLSVVCVRPDKF